MQTTNKIHKNSKLEMLTYKQRKVRPKKKRPKQSHVRKEIKSSKIPLKCFFEEYRKWMDKSHPNNCKKVTLRIF